MVQADVRIVDYGADGTFAAVDPALLDADAGSTGIAASLFERA
jgi:hypothetical protein